MRGNPSRCAQAVELDLSRYEEYATPSKMLGAQPVPAHRDAYVLDVERCSRAGVQSDPRGAPAHHHAQSPRDLRLDRQAVPGGRSSSAGSDQGGGVNEVHVRRATPPTASALALAIVEARFRPDAQSPPGAARLAGDGRGSGGVICTVDGFELYDALTSTTQARRLEAC